MSSTENKENAGSNPLVTGAKTPAKTTPSIAAEKLPPLFRGIDWLAFLIAFGAVWITYFRTLAPELTLEDSGELCTGSFYAGIPHPPGYPFWAIYSYIWTVILPFGNVAWRVEVGESTAAAFACGLVGLMVSRSSSMLMEGIEELKNFRGNWETAVCLICGVSSGLMLGMGGTMWVESVAINRISLFGVPWVMMVLVCMLRWMYAPHQRRYLLICFFLLGICATIHQTLLVVVLAIEVGVVLAQPRLGRTFLLGNGSVFVMALLAQAGKLTNALDTETTSPILLAIFYIVGISSLIGYVWLCFKTRTTTIELALDACIAGVFLLPTIALSNKLPEFAVVLLVACLAGMIWLGMLTRKIGNEWWIAIVCAFLWLCGVSFYLYEAISGMTDPPMQWGYPREREGFFHALSRGQYEKANPTDLFHWEGLVRFWHQLGFLVQGIANEFNWVLLFVAIIPLMVLFLVKLPKRERAWLTMLASTYFCIGIILVILMNPGDEKQSVDLHQVFFTSSHGVVAIMFGLGLALTSAFMATNYKNFRIWGLFGGIVAVIASVYNLYTNIGIHYAGIDGAVSPADLPRWVMKIFEPGQYSLPIIGTVILIGLCAAFLAGILIRRDKAPLALTLGVIALMPLYSGLAHWGTCEQRDHWFGYWFGHDMFTPPFTKGETKEPIYPQMTRDAILYGGTDPGRFCPTYMIFCESFIPHQDQPLEDQKFDRRDVYIITQNALADPTYLEYLRAQYNRSLQKDTPFFQEMLRGDLERQQNYKTNTIAKLAYEYLDKPLTAFGARVEARRRAEGVYPPKEIYIPSPEDSTRCFNEYSADAAQRSKHDEDFPQEPPQVKPGEEIKKFRTPDGDRISVSGQVAVMSINGLLTKVIFDHCPTNEFFVEESFPLDWMYPYESPYGIIMKVNRQPLEELTDKMLADDHEFWSKYSDRLIGNWITYDTSVSNICEWIEKVHLEKNFKDFKGNEKFIRDEMAQKAFSKLRSSIGGLYDWRFKHAKSEAERQRMLKEADFAYRQSFAYCPYSPEVVFRYVQLLITRGVERFGDAVAVAKTCSKMDPNNTQISGMVKQLEGMRDQHQSMPAPQASLETLEKAYRSNLDNFQAGFTLAGAYYQNALSNKAFAVMDEMLKNPKADGPVITSVINFYVQTKSFDRIEAAYQRMTEVYPHSPEAWMQLAYLQVQIGKSKEAVESASRALTENDLRLKTAPTSPDVRKQLKEDVRLKQLKDLPGVQALL